MSESDSERVYELFVEALSRPAGERSAFLDSACVDEPGTRAEVESLLQHKQEAPRDFLRPLVPPPSWPARPLVEDAGHGAGLEDESDRDRKCDRVSVSAANDRHPQAQPRERRRLCDGVGAKASRGLRKVADSIPPPAQSSCGSVRGHLDGSASPADLDDPLIGIRVGRYRIRRMIASGGMGIVYEAEQDRPNRLVALKMMRIGLSDRAMLHRFEIEPECLARLQHPHIAQVHDAGMYRDGGATGTPVPYFVMEFVEHARTITEYAEQNGLGTRERLELFVQVCEAVHHGHVKGIVHRDLKPANILVDGGGQVKVIDFGVARMTDSDVAVTTMRTDVGQLLGTLQYMSPEQCMADVGGIDVRSDVYSLGVVLYELLAGQPPYDVAHRPIPSATRVICEEPPVRLSSINRKLRGDLEVIVLTALEKEPQKRYRSVDALAADIRRYLHGEPVAARPPTTWTRTMRWVTRHPRISTALASLTFGIMILGGTLVATWLLNYQPWRVELATDRSEVRLLAYSGRPIHVWQSVQRGFKFAELAKQPIELGGRRLAVLGYNTVDTSPLSGALAACDIRGDLDEPLWTRRIDDEDIPPQLVAKRPFFVGKDFHAERHLIGDVFPECPGRELVVAHQHRDYTHTALRIYDLAGGILYQVWLDMKVYALYWMHSAQQLIVTGLNGAAFWEERGYPEVEYPHPTVVLALHPEPGFLARDYVDETPGEGQLDPIWYRCVGPPEASDWEISTLFGAAYGSAPRGHSLALGLFVGGPLRAGMSFVIDDAGREVPGTRKTDDRYKRNRDKLPDYNWFQLMDLPPIKKAADNLQDPHEMPPGGE